MTRVPAPAPRPLSAKILVFLVVLDAVLLCLPLVINAPLPSNQLMAVLLVQVLLVVFHCISEKAVASVILAIGKVFRVVDLHRKP